MKQTARLCLGLLTATTLLAFSACTDDETPSEGDAGGSSRAGAEQTGGTHSPTAGGAPHAGGAGGDGHSASSAECKVLGNLCHAADAGPGPVSDCHELGHLGVADGCHAGFESCIDICVPTEGAGGGGGAGASHGSAYCEALSELCHAAGDVDAAARDCHDLGHVGNAANCEGGFEDCAALCLAIIESGAGHAGGAGGVGHAGGAGGAGGAH